MNPGDTQDRTVRSQLIASLHGGEAFDRVESILEETPPERRFELASGMERSAWQILDHMRRTLEDLVAFSDNAEGGYVELDWPDGYWPEGSDPGDAKAWVDSLQGFLAARKRLEELIVDPSRDLMAKFPWGDGQTLLREAILAIEHTAYHAGELVELGRTLGPLGPGDL